MARRPLIRRFMKSAASLLMFLLASVPMHAQVLEEQRATVLGIGGDMSWGVAVNGRAVGWSMDHPRHNVRIAANLGNGGGHAYIAAYLMRSIGPGTSKSDEIARISLDLPYPYHGWILLFADVDLEEGEYWLVIARPTENPHSSINWITANPMKFEMSDDARYLGTRSYTFYKDGADYIPASNFNDAHEPYGFQIAITADREP